MIDYHIHTRLCKHAVGEIEAYVEKALEYGLREIGFSDHIPLPNRFDSHYRMEPSQLPEYFEQIRRVQERYPEITIRLGIEADYLPEMEDYLQEFMQTYPLDFAIVSVHYIGPWGFDILNNERPFSQEEVEEVFQTYYGLLQRAVETGLFDIVGHFDLPKRNGYRPLTPPYALIQKVLESIRRENMALEINTSGLRHPAGEMYPGREVIREAASWGIPFTIGSDAHDPQDVGRDLDRALTLLKELGVHSLCTYRQRRCVPVAIPS